MLVPNRHGSSDSYRYGFNGMEKDNELKGEGNSYTTLYRGYDSRISRWISIDPEEKQFPELSPYNNNENNPIINADPDGDCPWCAGAAIAAGLDIGLQLVEIGLTDKNYQILVLNP